MEDRGSQPSQITPRFRCGNISTKVVVPVCPSGPMCYEQRPRRWKDEMKLKRERLQVYLIAEEKKALRFLQIQRESVNQELRELRLQQLELAQLHSHNRVMYFGGWKPWLGLMLFCRSCGEQAIIHSTFSTMRKSLRAWKLLVSGDLRERNVCKKLLCIRADYFRSRWLQRNSWRAWFMLQRAVTFSSWTLLRSCLSTWRKYCAAGVAVHVAGLLKHTWSTWLHSVEEIKNVKLLKNLDMEGLADGHARRNLQRNALHGWQEEACRCKEEAGRIRRHAEAWLKIHSWLEELEQNKSRPTSIIRQLVRSGV